MSAGREGCRKVFTRAPPRRTLARVIRVASPFTELLLDLHHAVLMSGAKSSDAQQRTSSSYLRRSDTAPHRLPRTISVTGFL